MTDIHVNIASHLPVIASQQPDALAVAIQHTENNTGKIGYSECTFKELNDRSDDIARGLENIGISHGVRTVLMVKPGMDFFALTFGLFKVGAVPVLVDPGMGVKNLKKCLAEAQPHAFIGIPKAHFARILLGWGKATVKILLTVGKRFFWGGTTLNKIAEKSDEPYTIQDIQPNETAAILFTSGSTGIPKGAVYTHEIFNTQVEILRNDYRIEPGERDVATFPLFALFGPALGMAAIVPDMDASKPAQADPRKIIAAATDYKATNMFCSPALIEKVGRYGFDREGTSDPVKLPSIRRVISAGAPAKPDSLERFKVMLADGVEVLTSYGATEALPISYIGTNELLTDTSELTSSGSGICVGRPVTKAKIRIITITDEPIKVWSEDLVLPHGQRGEITIQGPMVSRRYYNRAASTELAKIEDNKNNFFCHRLGDIGYFDDKGRLWMCGRKSQRVVLDNETLFTIPCERIFDTHPDVWRTALVKAQEQGNPIAVLCVELMPGTRKNKHNTIRTELLEKALAHPTTNSITTILFNRSFPVDIRHNAKIFREKLSVWAQKQIHQGNCG